MNMKPCCENCDGYRTLPSGDKAGCRNDTCPCHTPAEGEKVCKHCNDELEDGKCDMCDFIGKTPTVPTPPVPASTEEWDWLKKYCTMDFVNCVLCGHAKHAHFWNGGGVSQHAVSSSCLAKIDGTRCICTDYDEEKDFKEVEMMDGMMFGMLKKELEEQFTRQDKESRESENRTISAFIWAIRNDPKKMCLHPAVVGFVCKRCEVLDYILSKLTSK